MLLVLEVPQAGPVGAVLMELLDRLDLEADKEAWDLQDRPDLKDFRATLDRQDIQEELVALELKGVMVALDVLDPPDILEDLAGMEVQEDLEDRVQTANKELRVLLVVLDGQVVRVLQARPDPPVRLAVREVWVDLGGMDLQDREETPDLLEERVVLEDQEGQEDRDRMEVQAE